MLDKTVIALGYFDSVHLGHQKVIQAAVDGVGQSAVITFKESPAKFFSKEPIKYISTREERRAHIEALGVDYLFELDFTQELAQMTGEEYLRDIADEYGIIVCGSYDPEIAGVANEDFYDSIHARPEAVKRMLQGAV